MGGGSADRASELVVGRQVLYLFLKESPPLMLKPLTIFRVGLAKLELATIIAAESEIRCDPVVRALKRPMVERGHGSQLLNELVIDPEQSAGSQVAIARSGEQSSHHLAVHCMLNIHQDVVVVTWELRANEHRCYSTGFFSAVHAERPCCQLG